MLKQIETIQNADLSKFSTLKIGGKAKHIFFPKNKEEVCILIKESIDKGKEIHPIGIGSNTIFSDGILDKFFISTKNLKKINITKKNKDVLIEAEAGVSFKEIINIVKKYNLEGFENLSGIPASIGGAVAMNAGAFGSEIFDILEEVEWIDSEGNIHTSLKDEISFSYRKTQFQKEGFVYKAKLKLKKSDKDIPKIIKEHLLERNKKQPLNLPTTGSTYKNPEGNYAGYLLEQAGLKGYKINDIGFSEKHANFLVNYGNGQFKDLMRLLEYAEETIENIYKIKLEREIKIVK